MIGTIVDTINKINIGLNFFGLVAGVFSIVALFVAIRDIKDAKARDDRIKDNEIKLFCFKNRNEAYKKIVEMFDKYYEMYPLKTKEFFLKLDDYYRLALSDLEMFFDKIYIAKFKHLYCTIRNDCFNNYCNEVEYQEFNKRRNNAINLLEKTGISMGIEPMEIKETKNFDDIQSEIESFKIELRDYIIEKSGLKDK